MLEKTYFPRLLAGLLAASLALCGAGAWASTDPMAAEGPAVEADRPSDASRTRLVAELQQRIKDKSVRELRASANGEYATTLMLAEDEVVCYVGLLYRADNDAREADNRSARSQLAKLRQEIRRLEASLADSGQKLPAPDKVRR